MLWDAIQKELDKKDWTVYKLAKEAKLTESTVRSIKLRGSRTPRFDTVVKIANALDCSLDNFREAYSNIDAD